MPRYLLRYAGEDGAQHEIGEPVEAPDEEAARRILMDLYWDDRLDAASCAPIVALARIDDDDDCEEITDEEDEP